MEPWPSVSEGTYLSAGRAGSHGSGFRKLSSSSPAPPASLCALAEKLADLDRDLTPNPDPAASPDPCCSPDSNLSNLDSNSNPSFSSSSNLHPNHNPNTNHPNLNSNLNPHPSPTSNPYPNINANFSSNPNPSIDIELKPKSSRSRNRTPLEFEYMEASAATWLLRGAPPSPLTAAYCAPSPLSVNWRHGKKQPRLPSSGDFKVSAAPESSGALRAENVQSDPQTLIPLSSGPTIMVSEAAEVAEAPRIASGSVDMSGHLALENIRDSLIRQEDSIIFNLIERAQYKLNAAAYDPNMISVPGFPGSLMEYLLQETEVLHGKVRRYTAPAEHPFFPEVIPPIILPSMSFPQVLHPAGARVSITPLIWRMYFGDLLPALVSAGDDNNYGSSVTTDVLCLQALSKRIHSGAFVAEAKFQESPGLYTPLIQAQDKDGLMQLLTFKAVEAKVLERVELKAAVLGQEIGVGREGGGPPKHKIDTKLVARLYGEWIMPLTKEVQVEYLLRRLNPLES